MSIRTSRWLLNRDRLTMRQHNLITSPSMLSRPLRLFLISIRPSIISLRLITLLILPLRLPLLLSYFLFALLILLIIHALLMRALATPIIVLILSGTG